MNTVFGLATIAPMNEDGFQLLNPVPPPLCSEHERPDKEAAVQSLLSRFNLSLQSGSQCSSGQETCP